MTANRAEAGAGLIPVDLTVNGRPVHVEVERRTHLGDLLRDHLDLTGTHLGCEHGVCGACTVLLDGEPARACIAFAGTCAGATVTTIEGLDGDEVASELRAAFNREHALQCGYCTPGMLMTARDLVLRLTEPDDGRIRIGLAGNLCRCTGYVGIVRAVRSVIADRRGRGIGARAAEGGRGIGPVGAALARQDPAIVAPTPRPASADQPQPADVPADFVPAHGFDQSFAVAHPPDAVFALFGDVDAVASCLPGAAIVGRPAPDLVEGRLTVKLGPIAATFRGTARIERGDADRSGRIIGAGRDAGGRSATRGEIRYRVDAGPTHGHARVMLSVGYTLVGPLAQFGRPGLVRDFAGRLAQEFAGAIEARLSGRPAPATAAGLNPLRLAGGLVLDRMTALVRRVRAAVSRR